MRIPTYSQFKHQANNLADQFDQINRCRTQISTGKKLLQSSDDPILSSRIKSTEDYINKISSYQNNGTIASSRASLFESSVQNSINIVNRIQELIKTAQTDTASNEDRQNIARELEGHLTTLLNLANSRDANGEYVFSGMNSNIMPFQKSNGVYTYLGSMESSRVNIGPSSSTVFNESGYKVFGDIKQGNGYFTVTGGVTNTGTAETSVGQLNDVSQYVEDTYTISFVTNGSGRLAYQIIGANSGQVIPAPPAAVPADAPDYAPGQDITFNGIGLTISGSPIAGDQFTIAPSTSQNIFETLNKLIQSLSKPVTDAEEKAKFHQEIAGLSASFGQVITHFTASLSEIGVNINEIESQIKANQNLLIDQKAVLSNLSDTDIYEASSELTGRMTSLQLSQETYLKMQEFMSDLLRILR